MATSFLKTRTCILFSMLFIVFASFLCFITKAETQNVNKKQQELFSQANKLYKNGNFSEASELYQQITEKSPQTYYNLGNCAFRLRRVGYALLYWRRAEQDWGLFGRSELLKNIAFLKRKTQIKKQENQQNNHLFHSFREFFKSVKRSFISHVKTTPLIFLQLLALLLWFILFFYHRYLYKKQQKIIIILLFVSLALATSMLALKYSLQIKKQLVIVKPKAPLLSGPGRSFSVLGHLPEAQEAVILKKSGIYYKIRFDSHTGWLNQSFAEKI